MYELFIGVAFAVWFIGAHLLAARCGKIFVCVCSTHQLTKRASLRALTTDELSRHHQGFRARNEKTIND